MSWRSRTSSEQTQLPARLSSTHSQVPSNRWAAAAESSSRQPYRSYHSPSENDTEEDIRSQISETQQRSLDSSRRALQKLNATEDLSTQNMIKATQQTHQLSRIEQKLDQASHKISVSDAKADQLKSLNRWFFLPSFGGKKVNRVEEEAKARDAESKRHLEENKKRETGRSEEIARLASSQRQKENNYKSHYNTTPSGIERCEIENEMDDNLGKISLGLGRLKMMGQAMNEELRVHDAQLGRLRDKTAIADERVKSASRRIDEISKKG